MPSSASVTESPVMTSQGPPTQQQPAVTQPQAEAQQPQQPVTSSDVMPRDDKQHRTRPDRFTPDYRYDTMRIYCTLILTDKLSVSSST